jgi:hypothetical protein
LKKLKIKEELTFGVLPTCMVEAAAGFEASVTCDLEHWLAMTQVLQQVNKKVPLEWNGKLNRGMDAVLLGSIGFCCCVEG